MAKGNSPSVEVRITANDSEFTKATRKITDEVKKMAKDGSLGVLAMGTAFTALGMWMKDTLDTMDQVSKMSQKTGFSVESLSGLRYAAELAGVEIDAMEKSFIKMNRAVDDNVDAFSRLGISLRNEKGNLKANDELLLEIADKFKGMDNGAQKTAIAMEIFGKSGGDMIPFLNAGAEGIKKLTDEAEALGITFDTASAQKAEAFNDSITTITNTGKGFVTELVVGMMPAITDITQGLTKTSATATNGGKSLSVLQIIARGLAVAFQIVTGAILLTGDTLSLIIIALKDAGVFMYNFLKMLFQFSTGDFSGGMKTFEAIRDKSFAQTQTMWAKLANDAKKVWDNIYNTSLGKNAEGTVVTKTGGNYSGESTDTKTAEAKKDIYTEEEMINDQYRERISLADTELDKAELELELKSKLFDLAQKNNETQEQMAKRGQALLDAQIKYVEAEEKVTEELRKQNEEAAKKNADDIREVTKAKYDAELAGLKGWERDELAEKQRHNEEMNRIATSNNQYKNELLKIEEANHAKNMLDIAKATEDAKLGVVSDALGAASAFLSRHTLMYKTIAIAQATIDTYLAATKALATLPPPWGAIAMGTSIATGLTQVATIAGIQIPGYATGGFAMVGEKGPEIIAPVQDYASGQAALISAVVSRMNSFNAPASNQRFYIKGDDLVSINDRNKYIKSKKAW